jgi:hypothetical protein
MPALADARAPSSIAVHWIKNNALAAVLSGLTSFLLYVLRNVIGAGDSNASVGAIAFICVAAVALWGFYGAAGAVLSGAVLQRIIPRLPVWAWIVLHVVAMATVGLGSEMMQTLLPRPPTAAAEETILATLMSGLIMGAALGAVSGGLEALVLRTAAFGTASWIAWSTVAFALTWSLLVLSAKLWDLGTDLGGELATEVLNVLTTALAAVLMIPALGRLRSRGLSGAPHYFT